MSHEYHKNPAAVGVLNPEQYHVTQENGTERPGAATAGHDSEYERAHQWRDATRELVLTGATAMAAADQPQSQGSISITLTGNALSNDLLLADTGNHRIDIPPRPRRRPQPPDEGGTDATRHAQRPARDPCSGTWRDRADATAAGGRIDRAQPAHRHHVGDDGANTIPFSSMRRRRSRYWISSYSTANRTSSDHTDPHNSPHRVRHHQPDTLGDDGTKIAQVHRSEPKCPHRWRPLTGRLMARRSWVVVNG